METEPDKSTYEDDAEAKGAVMNESTNYDEARAAIERRNDAIEAGEERAKDRLAEVRGIEVPGLGSIDGLRGRVSSEAKRLADDLHTLLDVYRHFGFACTLPSGANDIVDAFFEVIGLDTVDALEGLSEGDGLDVFEETIEYYHEGDSRPGHIVTPWNVSEGKER